MKKISFQKVFCFISILFITSCCFFYGFRFIKLYAKDNEKNSLVKVVKETNKENELFKAVNSKRYFSGKSENNYLMYSNLLWRIITVNEDNSITMISEKSLTSLAFGKDKDFNTSYIFNWLNKGTDENTGVLYKALNNPELYLQKTSSCTDKLDNLTNEPCKNSNDDNYFSLLSVSDYINIGSKESYINNNEYFYLNNTNKDGLICYITSENNATLGTGNDIIGVRPVITLKANIDYVSGDGSKEKPYMIETDNGLFGSYVKLDNAIWRIYKVNEKDVRLVLNDYLKVNGENVTNSYSTVSSFYNDTKYGGIAYYLNTTFLNKLSYKKQLHEVTWANGYYNKNTDYDYKYAFEDTIESTIATLSIGDIILNSELDNYFIMTGSAKYGSMVYLGQKDKKLFTKQISANANIVPTISLDKDLLSKGKGTIDEPYEME